MAKSSTVLSFPTGDVRTPPTNFSPLGMLDIAPSFDLHYHMIHNRHSFSGKNPLSIYHVPTVLLSVIDRFRCDPLLFEKPPKQNSVFMACICNGVREMNEHPTIIEFLNILHLSNQIPTENAWIIEEVRCWFNTFKLTLSVPITAGAEKKSCRINDDTFTSIKQLRDDLGIHDYLIAVYAAMFTLVNQIHIIENHRVILQQTIDGFIKRLHVKTLLGKVLLAQLDQATLKAIEGNLNHSD